MSDILDTRAQLLQDVLDRRLGEVHVSMPGRIVSYDASTQLAEVECLLNPTLMTAEGEETIVIGVITNVPIEFPSGGGYFMSFPLAAGDPVKLTFHDYSLDVWMQRGGVVDVKDLRSHHQSDASAYPGLRAKPQKLTSASATKLVIGKDDDTSMQITIDGSTIKIGDTATSYVALATQLNQILTALYAVVTSNCAAPGAPLAGASALLSLYPSGFPSVAATKVQAI